MANPFYQNFQFQGPTNGNPNEAYNAGGFNYTPIMGQGSYQGQDNYTPGQLQGYRVTKIPDNIDPSAGPGQFNDLSYDFYNPQGQFQDTGTWSDLGDFHGMSNYGFLIPFLMAAGMAGLQGMGIMPGGAAGGEASLGDLFSQGFTDGGTTGGALDTAWASGSAGTPGTSLLSGGVLPNGTGGAVTASSPGLADSFRYGYTDGGGIGPNADTTAYNTGSAGTPFTTGAGPVVPNGSGGGNPVFPGSSPTGLPTGGSPISSGSGGSGGGFDLGKLFQLLAGFDDANRQDNATDTILNWLNGQQSYIDGLYAPGSPEYNALWDQMSRIDAAAGRNSQYGPRSVDLAARLADIKGDQRLKLATGIAGVYSDAIDDESDSNAGIWSALGSMFGNSNSGSGLNINVSDLIKMFGG